MSRGRHPPPLPPRRPARMTARELLAAIHDATLRELALCARLPPEEARPRLLTSEERLRRQAGTYQANGRGDLAAALRSDADRLAVAAAELPPPPP